MKRIDTSGISTTAGFPFKKGTLEFIQDSWSELSVAIAKGLIGPAYDTSKIYQLSGLKTDSINLGGTSRQLFMYDGFYLYNNEIFQVDSKLTSWITGVSFGIDLFIETTQFTTNADPVTFSDSSTKNVHNIRKIVATNASGSASADSIYFSTTVAPVINHVTIGSDWLQPTYVGTYTDHSTQPIRYRQDGNQVRFKGRVANTVSATVGSSLLFAIEDSKLWPAYDKFFAALDLATVSKTALIQVTSAGEVYLRGDLIPSSNTGVVFNVVNYDLG